MLSEEFDYKDLAKNLVKQAGEQLPTDISPENAKYLLKTMYEFMTIAGKALVEDEENNYTSEQAMFVVQVIGEWTFHKTIDLCSSNISQEYWDAILQKIAFTIFELCKQGIENDVEKEELLNIIESHVIKVYSEALSKINKKNLFPIFKRNIIHFVKEDLLPIFSKLKLKTKHKKQETEDIEKKMQDLIDPNRMHERLGVDILSILIGEELLKIADPEKNGNLLPKLAATRQRLTDKLGYIIPKGRIMDSSDLDLNKYIISVRQNTVASGYVYPDKFMMLSDDLKKKELEIPENAIIGVDPITSEEVIWVDEDFVSKNPDITATEPVDVIIRHLEETVIKYVDEIFTLTDTLKLLELLSSQYNCFVEDLVPGLITNSDLRQIFVNLIREKVSIRDICFVFERLLDYARFSQRPDILSEHLRTALRRQTCLANANQDEVLYCCTLSEELDDKLAAAVETTELGSGFMLSSEQTEKVVNCIMTNLSELKKKHNDKQIVLLCSPRIRLPLFQLLSMYMPTVTVMSYGELIPEIKVEKLASIN